MTQNDLFSSIPDYVIEIWQGIVDSVASLISVPSVMINRLEPPDLEVIRSNSDPDNPFPTGTSMPSLGVYCAEVAKRREKLKVEDARKEPDWAESPTAKAGIYAYQGFPICWPDGNIFGTICAVDTKEHKWDATSENIMFTFKAAIEAHLAITAAMVELNKKNQELEKALSEVQQLQGLLPVCAYCRKIRDDKGYWSQIESYFAKHTELQFSHGICPDCLEKQMNDMKR